MLLERIISIVALLGTIFTEASTMTNAEVIEYLQNYGYLSRVSGEYSGGIPVSDNVDAKTVTKALKIFQKYWSLPVDGSVNRETETLMKLKRCGVQDDIGEYSLTPFKWTKRNLNWFFYSANFQQIETTKKAFEEWSKITGLIFDQTREISKADIIISFGNPSHLFVSDFSECASKLVNQTLGHAFYPNERNSVREIHLSKSIQWKMSLGEIPQNSVSLYWVLVHEIGHSLGINHSTVEDAVMFPFYRHRNRTDDLVFSYDDISAAEFLYKTKSSGNESVSDKPRVAATIPTTAPTVRTSTAITDGSTIDENVEYEEDSICRLNVKKMKFFICRKRFYIFYKKWVWPLNLDINQRRFEKPHLIRHWLPFLPKNFTGINALYERPNGHVVLFVDNRIYEFDPLTLRLTEERAITYQDKFGSNFPFNGVKAAVLSNTGKTYIAGYRGVYVMEIDECSFSPKSYIFFPDLFKGVGIDVKSDYSIFKYTNGHIYFLQGDRYYDFDEFNGVLSKSDTFDLSLFDIDCPAESTLSKLRRLTSKLLFHYERKRGDDFEEGDDAEEEDGNEKEAGFGKLNRGREREGPASFKTLDELKKHAKRIMML